jgi:uncharacterized protein YbcV (DUF1398 family)
MSNLETCRKRKYKKPLLKKCESLGIATNNSMTIDQLCNLIYTSRTKVPKTKKTTVSRKKVTSSNKNQLTLMEKKLQAGEFDFIAKYMIDCFS